MRITRKSPYPGLTQNDADKNPVYGIVSDLDSKNQWIRIQDGKNDPQNRKRLRNFMCGSAGCSLYES
jgi:hypothetical protein